MGSKQSIIPIERIEKRILLVRGHKVMLSTDLAELYGVEPRVLVQAVKRNIAWGRVLYFSILEKGLE